MRRAGRAAALLAAGLLMGAACTSRTAPSPPPAAAPRAPVPDAQRFPSWPGVEASREAPVDIPCRDYAESDRIDRAFDDAMKMAETAPPRIVTDAAPGAAGESPDWREVTVQRDRESLDRGDNLNRNFQVWTGKDGKVVLVRALLQSPSRDWAQFVDYLYRPDGTLALMNALLNSFEGDVSLRVARYYDREGAILRQLVSKEDLQRGGPVVPLDRPYLFVPFTVYPRTSNLPFSPILSRPRP